MKVEIIKDKVYGLLGLAMRAGKLVSGSFKVEESIKTGRARLVIVSEEASRGTIKKLSDTCRYKGIDLIQVGSQEALGKALGKPSRTVIAIEDDSFKEMIIGSMSEPTTNMGVID